MPVVQAKFKVLMQSAEKCGEWAFVSEERAMEIWSWETVELKCLLAHLEALLKTRLSSVAGCTTL